RTNAQILYLELTVLGEVVESGKEVLLKVKGTKEVFQLEDEPDKTIPAEGTALKRLKKAVAKGQKLIGVTGRVKGWSGHFPAVLRELPGEFAPLPENLLGPPFRRL